MSAQSPVWNPADEAEFRAAGARLHTDPSYHLAEEWKALILRLGKAYGTEAIYDAAGRIGRELREGNTP